MRYLLFFLILTISGVSAQVVNSNGSIVWNPSSYDSKVGYTFYSKGLMSGIMESTELIIENRSSYELFIKVSYTIYDNCGESKSYTKSETLIARTTSSSSGAFFSGIDFESNCKDISSYSSNLKTKIKNVTVRLISLENNTEKEQELQRKKQEEEIRKQREKQEELAKKKLEEERKKEAELKKKNEEENNRKTDEAALKRKLEEEASGKKAFEEKEARAKSLTDETERKEALNKIALEKKEIEKKTNEKKVAEKKDTRTEEEKRIESDNTQRNIRASQALEFEADRLRNTNPSAAKEKYEQAQIIHYTPRVEEKIKTLKSAFIADAAVGSVMMIDDITNQLDPDGKTRHSQAFSGYDGVSGNYDNLYSKYKQNPYNITFFGLRLSAIFLALEMRLGYNNSPVFEYEVISNERGEDVVLDKIGLQQQALSVGGSGGLNFKIKDFSIYGLYGIEWVGLQTSQKIFSENDQYKLVDKEIRYPDLIFSISMGLDYRIPNTTFGVGIRYNIKNIKTKPETNFIEINNSASNNSLHTYYLNKIVDTNYKFNDFGLRFIWDFD
ncbi:hypothetical protein [Lutibacter sp.]|uniref:hypothetical protein n=1 Tax=Lutibacter sp. TaxID=1925666 RepID=UPI00273274C3|nr:hypothetical protein [Lutibacter sp.]MDP3311875.1 hypothetical protein [Lutibacter sp.]